MEKGEETRARGIIRLYNDAGPSYRPLSSTFPLYGLLYRIPLCRNEQTEGWQRTENGYTDLPPAGAAVNILSPFRRGDGGRERDRGEGWHTRPLAPPHSPTLGISVLLAPPWQPCSLLPPPLSTGPPTVSHPYELKPDLMGWKRAARSSCIQLSLLSVLQPRPDHL